MERYREATLYEVVERILSKKLDEVYWQNDQNELVSAVCEQWLLPELREVKWFIREVVE